jgi:hypothetical protein
MDANRVTQRRQDSPGVELHPLRLVEVTGARKECLEAIGIFLDRAGAAALGELEQGRRT